MLETGTRERLRNLPAVDAVLRSPGAEAFVARHGRAGATSAVREALERARREILAGGEPEASEEAVLADAEGLLSGRGLRRVVNATGVVLHTNLGRSVLSEAAVAAAVGAAASYSNLEYDVAAGRRGSRYDHAVPLLTELTGAEDALVVNNCAGATLLALSAVVAEAREEGLGEPEVVVSRGQLIEIGGGFRIPEVLELSGARMREVGTTNRTRLSDYGRATNESTRALLWVHPSNFEIEGFTESVGVAELATLGPPVVADVGSGALLPLSDEPVVERAVRDGAALTIFSGDKLLGGPQAGIVVGESRWISAMRRHPLCRALRADKLCLAALEATLYAYRDGTAREDLPTLRMLGAPAGEMQERANRLAAEITGAAPDLLVDVAPSVARSGGGTLPLYEVPSYAVRIGGEGVAADAVAEALRSAATPVVGRVADGRLWLDVRTLLEGDEEAILDAIGGLGG
ncbi:L-seryl-tRNA(Sec) selenium transferase [Rubrobacter marinus]|uniref:L-seryl-tRNA(Sec) selenium transferase n=1 Tax=Rubrobacter marinus TaxID=2653852 RepID=A0A6G8PVR2_9ACTN|nr:L-seryl-tRNA(Sec) selenium transferase [Rubrobacter marinus]QIN78257.1 L-seryl-tRNA(Sec) selenium transferase [Rubrobacter marinus]